jgi:hypothetical protein
MSPSNEEQGAHLPHPDAGRLTAWFTWNKESLIRMLQEEGFQVDRDNTMPELRATAILLEMGVFPDASVAMVERAVDLCKLDRSALIDILEREDIDVIGERRVDFIEGIIEFEFGGSINGMFEDRCVYYAQHFVLKY